MPGTQDTWASSILNGAALRTCHRISWSRSCALAGIFSNRTSDSLPTVSGSTSAMRFGRDGQPIEHAANRRRQRRGIVHVDRVQRRRRPRQRAGALLHSSRAHACPPAPTITAAVTRRALISTAAAAAIREPAGHGSTHSTNVTLLISRSVVMPLRTCSTADSRRNRIPSSRAAFLISDVGRRLRISSRMLSLKSSSSQIAVRPR